MSMTEGNPSERRRARRIPCKIETDVLHDGSSIRGKILDLTIYGAFLSAPELPARVSLIRLTFRVGVDREVTVKGRIVWQRADEGIGVEFMETTPENVKDISEYLASLE